jgi:hypothetical protein
LKPKVPTLKTSLTKVQDTCESTECSGGYKRERETLPVDPEATDAFIWMVKSMQDGGGVSFMFDKRERVMMVHQ